MNLSEMQDRVGVWAMHNFGPTPAHRPLLGMVEEVGELSHAHLKAEQGIRGTQAEHDAKGRDAIGDILIYMAHYCCIRGWNMEAIVDETMMQVMKRDWVKYPKNGVSE